MDTIMQIAGAHDLLVIEDAAQAVNAYYKGRALGGIGHLGCYSFHETKNYISGEGGALLINDPRFEERAEIIWEKGTNRSQFFRGEVDKYTWVDVGSSFLPSELIAAFLFAQLEDADSINRRRLEIWERYYEGLADLDRQGHLRRPIKRLDSQHNGHMFHIILNSGIERDSLIRYLKDEGVHSVFHYVPLHSSPMASQLGLKAVELPVTDRISQQLLRLPCYFGLTFEEQLRIIQLINNYFGVKRS
jgi:dTDP-4-amino-4,6-dideoxygalactose transaminase